LLRHRQSSEWANPAGQLVQLHLSQVYHVICRASANSIFFPKIHPHK
jgi:hypothetical protein